MLAKIAAEDSNSNWEDVSILIMLEDAREGVFCLKLLITSVLI